MYSPIRTRLVAFGTSHLGDDKNSIPYKCPPAAARVSENDEGTMYGVTKRAYSTIVPHSQMWYAVTMKIHISDVEIKSLELVSPNTSDVMAVIQPDVLPLIGRSIVEVVLTAGKTFVGAFVEGTITTNRNYSTAVIVLDTYDGRVTIEGRYYGEMR